MTPLKFQKSLLPFIFLVKKNVNLNNGPPNFYQKHVTHLLDDYLI